MTDGSDKAATSRSFVEGLANGLSVLETFSNLNADLTVSETARLTGLTPATARRSLHTLVELGYLRQSDRRFVLSARVLNLASAYLRSTRSEEVLLPELRRLVVRFGGAASVSVLDRDQILYIAHYSEERATRMMASIGTSYPASATSMGKVLLSALPMAGFERYLDQVVLRNLTAHTICSKETLAKEINTCRDRGYATAMDELDYGITSLAVPVRSSCGATVAALNTSGYSGRLSVDGLVNDRLEALRVAAVTISHLLDDHPSLRRSLSGSSWT